jgi:hypothetical protein
MNDVIEIEENGEVVVLGEDSAASQISYQLAQDFYNEITGKSENKKESYRTPVILTLDNITQLQHRINQYVEQYNVCATNEVYSIKYIDDSSERFSGLERLKLHASGSGVAVEEFNAQFNFLVILPKTSRPQEYKISVKIVSRVAKIENMREEMGASHFQVPLHQFERVKTAVFSIDYVDISVANGFMSVLNNWFSAIEKNEVNGIIKIIRKYSHLFPVSFKYGFLALTSYYVFDLSSHIFVQPTADMRVTSLFILSSALVAFIMYRLGIYFGRKTERNVDNIYEPSYINFSGSDENFVKESCVKIKSSRTKAVLSIVGALCVGIIGSLLANWLSS